MYQIFIAFFLLLSSFPVEAKEESITCWNRSGLRKYSNQAEKYRGLEQTAEGSFYDGPCNQRTERIKASFFCRKPMLLDEARRLFVGEIQRAVQMIAAEQPRKIIEKNGPFTYRSLAYLLTFENAYKQRYASPYLDTIYLCLGKVIYHVACWQEIHEETFEEAVRIVEAEKRSQAEKLTSQNTPYQKQRL